MCYVVAILFSETTVTHRRYGRGTIEQRGDKWMVRVNHGIDPATGKRVRETRIVQGGKRAAERVLAEMVKRKEDHGATPTAQGRITLDAWVKEHLAAADLSPRTRAGQLDLWNRYSSPALRATALRDVTTALLQHRVNELREQVSDHTGKKLAPRTVQLWFSVVRAALADAMRLHRLSTNAARDVLVPGGSKTSKIGQALTPEEIQQFLAHDPEHRLRALWHVAYYVGVRPGELLALQWTDWDADAGTLEIRRALVRVGKAQYFARCKAGSERRVSVRGDLAVVLREHRRRQLAERLALGGEKWVDSSLMFTTEIGSALDHANVAHLFRAKLKAAKVRSVRWYDLRHSFGTHLIAGGTDARTVADLMGHADVSMTLRHYTHPNEAGKRAAIERLGVVERGAVR